MSSLVPSLVDGVLALTLAELLLGGLLARHRPAWLALLPNLAAGLCLMLALRAALAGLAWPWVPVALVAAGLAHATALHRALGHRPG